ncbi:MAG TPA: flagellar hook-associated protein FlgK [Terriglobia bacterium]|nr:flagellar hook-associated protein FlgK [Terriglobia bacterium]
MSTLFGSLSIALRSLLAQQGAMGVTGNNIANVNTPGYSRQRPVLLEESPLMMGSIFVGNGVSLDHIESIRDEILELRIQQETQQQNRYDAYLSTMQQVGVLFNETQGVGFEDAFNKFFTSLQSLSTDPTNIPLRQQVITAGQNLTAAFRQATSSLSTIQSSLDKDVTQSVSQINQLTSQIADLNKQIASLKGIGQDASALEDRRDLLTGNLSELVDISVIDAKDGTKTLTTTSGAALVVGAQSFTLDTGRDVATGLVHVFSQGTDITQRIVGGKLAGQIQVRDQEIPSAQSSLDDLAAGIISNFNAAHRNGFDLNGQAGGDFFTPFTQTVAGSNAGAAASFSVALTDPAGLAASSDGTAGDNGNALALAALRNQAVVSGQAAEDFYSNLVFNIGNKISDASTQSEAEGLVLQQLNNQRATVSGVSLDEEATNLIRYQRAFEAAARVVSVIDSLTSMVINMKGTS